MRLLSSILILIQVILVVFRLSGLIMAWYIMLAPMMILGLVTIVVFSIPNADDDEGFDYNKKEHDYFKGANKPIRKNEKMWIDWYNNAAEENN